MQPSSSSSANPSCPQGLIPEDSDSPNSHVPDLRRKILEASNICNIFSQATLLLDNESTGNGMFSAIQMYLFHHLIITIFQMKSYSNPYTRALPFLTHRQLSFRIYNLQHKCQINEQEKRRDFFELEKRSIAHWKSFDEVRYNVSSPLEVRRPGLSSLLYESCSYARSLAGERALLRP